MSNSCVLHTNSKNYLTMEKSVQCDNISHGDVDMFDTGKENQKIIVTHDMTVASIPMTNGHAPFPPMVQNDTTMTSKECQPQPLVKALSEEKYPFLQNIFGKKAKDDMNMEILDFHSKGKFALNPLRPKSSSLVTFIKFQQGEFVEVNSSSSYNSSMCLRDMKNAITTALDSCINQSNLEGPGLPDQPRPSPRRDTSANNTNESSPQDKNVTSKRSPPKALSVAEGNTGTSDSITGTFESSKDSKGMPTGSKGTPEGEKGTAEKSKKTPIKVKEKIEVKETPQPSKEKVDAFRPKPAKPAPPPARVKKLKIPDEESIKFANRQKEIMRMKKELKERLKREGKDGVDPATRLNAWGRTVGVTCTMCGHHVQKSYGCFRRDTAPEKLLHLFTPGMNRIKICRRCLPYKKHAGKDGESRVLSKPGLKALANDPNALNSGTNSPGAIVPLSDKSVSATTLNAIHRKVTGDQGNNGSGNVPHVNITPGHVNASFSLVNINAGHVNNGSGHVNNNLGHVNTSLGRVNIGSGLAKDSSGEMNVLSGHMNTGTDHVNTTTSHVNNEPSHMINTAASCLPPEIDLGQSGKSSAIEYIKRLALNLKSNHSGQQGENNITAKKEIVTPEEQVIKTPLLEHLASFTPVTPSMNLSNQIQTKTAANVGGKEPGPSRLTAQWKPVLSQAPVTPVAEDKASLGQATDGSVTSTPPWTTVPIVLKTQPSTNIV